MIPTDLNVVIEKDADGYYVGMVPALGGCHTQAISLDALMERVQEIIELCLVVEEPAANEFHRPHVWSKTSCRPM